ncbi:MAG: hypothetical protein LBC44_02850 [Mycoplasmataceae bacterium]|nr:hypothetical protein [Mycoplasmataceae bacterium]
MKNKQLIALFLVPAVILVGIPSLSLSSCSASSQTNNTYLLPTPIDLNDLFNFKRLTADNFIFPEAHQETIMTSGCFTSKLEEKTVLPLLKEYLAEGKTNSFYMDEITVTEITGSNFYIRPLPSSVHYMSTSSVKVNYPCSVVDIKKPISSVPGLLLTYRCPKAYSAADVEDIKQAIIASTFSYKLDLNQVDISVKDSTNWKSINSFMFWVNVTAKSDSNIYTGSTNIKIVQDGLTLEELIGRKHIGVCKVDSLTTNLTLSQVTDGLSKVNFNTVDETVVDGLELSGNERITETYERAVTLSVKPGSELAEIVDLNSTIDVTAYGVTNSSVIAQINGFPDKDNIYPFKYYDLFKFNNCIGKNVDFESVGNGINFPVGNKGSFVTPVANSNYPTIIKSNPSTKIIGWNEDIHFIYTENNWGDGFSNELDLTNCHFPKLQLLRVGKGSYRTLRLSATSDYDPKLFQWGTGTTYGLYTSSVVEYKNETTKKPYYPQTGIRKIYISDITAPNYGKKTEYGDNPSDDCPVGPNIFLGHNRADANWGSVDTNGSQAVNVNGGITFKYFGTEPNEVYREIHLPVGSKIQIFATNRPACSDGQFQFTKFNLGSSYYVKINYVYDNN